MRLVDGRANDLPPRWDGRVVSWTEWRPDRLRVCGSLQPDACLECGSTALPDYSRAILYPNQGDTHRALIEAATRRTGRRYMRERTVPTKPHPRLVAFRCPDCRIDQVLDLVTQTWWTLDEDDYGPEGSNP